MVFRVAHLLALGMSVLMLVPSPGHAQRDDLAAMRNAVKRLYQSGKYPDATAAARRYVDRAEQQQGTDNLAYATAISWLAFSLHAEGRFDEAEPHYKRALAIYEKVLGPDHRGAGPLLRNLAVLYQRKGRYNEAEALLKRRLAIREKVLGPDHPDVAKSLENLAKLYRSQGRNDEAEQHAKRARAIRDKARNPEQKDASVSPQAGEKRPADVEQEGDPGTEKRSRSADYAAIQRNLRRLDCYTGAVDGIWGAKSQSALVRAYRSGRPPSRAAMDALSIETGKDVLEFLARQEGGACRAQPPRSARRPRTRDRKAARRRETQRRTTRRRPTTRRTRRAERPRRQRQKKCRAVLNPEKYDIESPGIQFVCE